MQNQDDLETLAQRTTAVSRSLINRIAFFGRGEALLYAMQTPPVIINTGRRLQSSFSSKLIDFITQGKMIHVT